MFFFGSYEGRKENSESPVTRGGPSDAFRDGILTYVCATPSQCPATSVQGFSANHPIPAGYYGLTPAEIAAIDPIGIGPSFAASQMFKQYPSPNAPGLDGVNIMDYLFAAPIKNDYKTFIGRYDYKVSDNQSLFARGNIQDDVINAAPQFPGGPSARQTLQKNNGFAIGHDYVLGPTLVNSLRYGMTKIDNSQVGTLNSNYVTFRFISSLDPYTATQTRETPTHNIVDDLSWLKGKHTIKTGANLRFTRIPSTRNSGSFNTTSINPSWVAGVERYQPGSTSFCTCRLFRRAGEQQASRPAMEFC